MDSLVVTGVHAMLHDDDAAAAFVNSGDSLMTWSCDETIRMDRFDVRHLLLDASDIRTAGRHKFTPDVSEEVLDEERYRDLQEGGHEDGQDVEDNAMDERPSTAEYATVPFNYGSSDRTEEKPVQAVKVDKDEPPFVPSFPVPEHLEPHLPPSQKIHHIMCGTAKFVRERGGQTEIILRVKQANNPNFGFLMPDHVLHPYFRYLVDHPEISTEAIKPKEAPKPGNALVTKPAEGLRLLGEVYGDDDEDDDGSAPKFTVEVKTIKEPPPNLKSVIQKMVEFIARNGKAFEDVVKERDKNDERFQFLHPWHEYHPYYLSKLQIVDQMNLAKPQGNATAGNQQPARRKTRFDVPPSFLQAPSAKISPIVVGKTSATSSPAMVGNTSETNSPYSLMVRKTSEVTSPLVLSGGEEFMGVAQHEQPDMCYDAAYAAVIAATRTGVHGSGVGTDEETGSDVDTAGKAGIPGKAGSDGESHEKAGPAGETDSHGKAESGTEKADKKAERLRKARMLLAQMGTGDQTEVFQKQHNSERTESQKQQVDEPQNEDGESVRHRGRHREKKRKRYDYEDDDDRSRRHRRHDGDGDDDDGDGDGDDLHRSHRGHRSHREDDDGDDHHRSHKRYDADDVDDRHRSGRNRRRHDDEDGRHRVKEDDHHRRRRSRYDAGEAEHDHRARRSRRRSYRDLEDEDGDYRGGRKSHREEKRRSREEESKKVMMFKDEDEDEKDESNPVVSEDIRAKVRQMLQSI